MISAEEMPDDNAELAGVAVDFPRLREDSPTGCPVSLDDVSYLADEVPGGASLTRGELTFLRTAQVEASKYWIWRFREPEGGDEAYVTVATADGAETIGYETNYYGLSPEQFILGDYHGVF